MTVEVHPLAEAAGTLVTALDQAADHIHTPSGAGTMVWRAWGRGTPVVMVHGGFGSWTHWVRNIQALRRHHRVIVADIPGFGDSSTAPTPDDARSVAEVMNRGLRQVVGRDRLDLVAFSMGCTIAARMACDDPGLIRRMVMVAPAGLGVPLGAFTSIPVRSLAGPALMAAHRANLLGLMLHSEQAADEPAIRIQADNVERSRAAPQALVTPESLVRLLPELRVQVDIILGEHDRLLPDPDAQIRETRRFQPHAEVRVVEGAGHWVMYENAVAFDRVLREFLRRPLRVAL